VGDSFGDRVQRRQPAVWAALLLVYVVAGKLGLKLAFVHASATAVWPAAGIALAALLLLGLRLWPLILLGAFVVNVTTAGSALSSLGIAAGNTLEAVIGAWLVQRFASGVRAFERPRDVFGFAALAGMAAPVVAASFGVTSLALAGHASWADYESIWLTWWLGDVGGELIVAPWLLVWAVEPRLRWRPRRALEALALALCLAAMGLGMFGGVSFAGAHALSFLCLPPLLWAAFRFGPRGAATATALLSASAIWAALHGQGPFVLATPNQTLLLLQGFMAVMSVTSLAVAAAVTQRRRTEEALARIAAIVDSSDDAIIGKSLDGTIVAWNRGAQRLYGYAPEEMLGRDISLLAVRGQQDETPAILEKLRRGERIENYETLRATRDGREVTVSLTVSPVSDASGTLVGASAIARDITARKRAERRLATQFAVTRALAEAPTLRDAAARFLRAVCDGLGFQAGELWLADEAGPLRREAAWPPESEADAASEALAAQAWETGRPLWVDGAGDEPHALVAAPVRERERAAGALAFRGREPNGSPAELLETLGDFGARVSQLLERERALARMRRLEKAVETLELGVTITDTKGRIVYTNPAEAELHGYRVEELIGKDVSVFMPASWQPAPGRPHQLGSWRRETVNVRRDGTIFPVQLLSNPVTDADGAPIGTVTCCEEITERKRLEQALRSSEARYRLLFEQNLAGVYRATLQGRILECNEAFARMLGYASAAEVLERSAWDLFASREDRERSLRQLRERGSLTNFELRLRRKDGSTLWVLENETLLRRDDGEGDVVAGTLIDVTDRKLQAQRVEFHAYHDALTGLPNRIALRERMYLALAQARRNDTGLAALFLDLDGFKAVNDGYGHALGDRLLRAVAGRLRDGVRGEDTVARVGGDEFVLVLSSVRRREGAARVVKKLLERLAQPFLLDGRALRVGASVGVALFPQDGDDEDTLLRSADAAMYKAKQRRGGFQFCDSAIAPGLAERLAQRERLRGALERGEMGIVYGPEVDLRSGRVVGLEALLRWRDPASGTLRASEFVPAAEQTGLIVRLGEWALRRACERARALQAAGPPWLRLSVNVSSRQLRDADFTAGLERILLDTQLDPARLDLDVAESAATQGLEATAVVLRDLVSLGVGLCIDDFGARHSSFTELKLIPARRLKIDPSLVAGVGREPRERVAVQGIIELAHSLGLATVAEGVETEEQRAVLAELGCDGVQGALLGAPVSDEGLDGWLAGADGSR
jgi:diguanylate cyclase (GGDEF)-like protein/PAS domain S-box-containing protein